MITLYLAILLAVGLLAAKFCQRCYLPSVTGYILAGLLLGPGGFGLITEEALGGGLDHFTHIALMLIAFGVGEHIELKKLRVHARSVIWIGVCEVLGAFILVTLAILLLIQVSGFQVNGWQGSDYWLVALLLGAMAASGAPSVTLLVVRELKAGGTLTASLLAVVAIESGLALMIIGLVVSLAHSIMGQAGGSLLLVAGAGILEIASSLFLGICAGLSLDLIARKLKNKGEILIAGLSLLLLCSELARYLNLSSMLAGMAAGFILVNRGERDVRIFRAFNSFEPPIYVLFFTLVGIRFDWQVLEMAGLIGVYFLARICGKILGVIVGARRGRAPLLVQRYMGVALVPQAGIAISLVFFLAGDPALVKYAVIMTPVGLTGVFLSQLFGSFCTRFALIRAGEAHGIVKKQMPARCHGLSAKACELHLKSAKGVCIIPWNWSRLVPHDPVQGVVVFGAAHHATVAGLARFATIFAHYCHALPMAVRVQGPGQAVPPRVFQAEQEEVAGMGYPLATELVPDTDVASGLVAAVEYNMAHAVFLGYPLEGEASRFQEVLEVVAANVRCPVVVVRFFGDLHSERILVVVVDLDELEIVYPLVVALNSIGEHRLELLYLLHSGEPEKRMAARKQEVRAWLAARDERLDIAVKIVATDARVQTIQDEAQNYDLVVMGASRNRGFKKFFFGSLADAVAHDLQKTLLIVYSPEGL